MWCVHTLNLLCKVFAIEHVYSKWPRSLTFENLKNKKAAQDGTAACDVDALVIPEGELDPLTYGIDDDSDSK